MQINTYISEKDFNILVKAKPKTYKSVPSFMADIIRQRAAEEEKRQAMFDATWLPKAKTTSTIVLGEAPTYGTSGEPIIPQYERQ